MNNSLDLKITLPSKDSNSVFKHCKGAPLLLVLCIVDRKGIERDRDKIREQILKSAYRSAGFDAPVLKEKPKSSESEQTVIVGSRDKPLSGMISFELTEENGRPVDVTPKLLNSCKPIPDSISFQKSKRYHLLFGMTPDDWKAVAPGEYQLVAKLSMGSGVTSSPVRIQYTGSAIDDSEQANYQAGRYYILDNDFENSMKYAERILEQNKDSISGLELKADSLAGQGKKSEAITEFEKADKLYHKQQSNDELSEPPGYIWRRLRELRQ